MKDCIIAWSGGVESTALVIWALEQNYNPLIFHASTSWDDASGDETLAIDVLKKHLGVQCLNVENKAYGPVMYNGSPMQPGRSIVLNFHLWMSWGVTLAQHNKIEKLFYGNNNGLYKAGDGLGDQAQSDYFTDVLEGSIQVARGLWTKLDVQCPLVRPKVELWNMIPDECKPHVYTSDIQHKEWKEFYDREKSKTNII